MGKEKQLAGLLVLLIPLGALSACTAASEPDGANSPSSSVTAPMPTFVGTPEEHTELMRACFEQSGLKTGPMPNAPDSSDFTVDTSTVGPEAFQKIQEDCLATIGLPQMAGLSDSELQRRYDVRVAQWQCLVDKGLVYGDPLTFDEFVDQYRRGGEKELWEPTTNATVPESGGGPSDICPRSDQTW